MKKNITKVITIIFIITINFILNISLGQGGGLFGHGPTPEGGGGGGGLFGHGGMSLGNDTNIYTNDLGNVIDIQYDGNDTGSILHIGSRRIFGQGNGQGNNINLVGTNQNIDNYNIALTKILNVIQNIVNYALGILGVVVLIYLIIHGFMILTAAGDDGKVKKGFKGIKNAVIALAGIGLSRLIISFILRLINTLSS